MILTTLGMPCRFSEWCERLLPALAGIARADVFVADGLAEVGRHMLQHRAPTGLHISRAPEAALARALVEGGHPFLVTLAPPRDAVAELMTDYSHGFGDAVRAAANAMTALLPVVDCPQALVLRPGDARETATAIARHFGLDIKAIDTVLEQVPFALAPASLPLTAAPTVAGFEAITGQDSAMVLDDALAPLWQALGGAALGEITWHGALFYLGDEPRSDAARLINVTGSSRCLAYGPYIRLTEGPWSCSLLLGLSEHAAGLKLVAEVFAGDALTRVALRVTEGGIFETEFSFVNAHPDQAIQVRLFNETASFEGEIVLALARMTPLRARRLKGVVHG